MIGSMLLAAAIAMPSGSTLACEASAQQGLHTVSDTKQEKPAAPERCKRKPGSRTPVPKGCPDGGERLPQDKRSPLDSAFPLAPLV